MLAHGVYVTTLVRTFNFAITEPNMRTLATTLLVQATMVVLLLGNARKTSAQAEHRLDLGTACMIVWDFQGTGDDPIPGEALHEISCPFDTPDGGQTVSIQLHQSTINPDHGHASGKLNSTWDNLWYASKLTSYNPRVVLHLGCAPSGDDGSNAEEVETPEMDLASDFQPHDTASWHNVTCPADKPMLVGVWPSTIATW